MLAVRRLIPILLLALAAPPAAARASQLATNPVAVGDGYRLTVLGGDGSPIRVRLLKKVRDGDQDVLITRKATYSARPDLSRATLKADLGALGKVSLTFHARGRMHRLGVPKGCTGKPGRGRNGTVTGRVALTIGVLARRAPAVLAHRGGDVLCLDPLHYPNSSRRLSLQVDPETSMRVDQTSQGTIAAATLDRDYPGGVEVLSVVTQRGPSSAFGVTGSLASVSGDQLGPFFAGRMEFLQGLGYGLVRAGDLRILFDFFGAKTVSSGVDGILHAGGG